jgi:chemotaxis protein methyltransferase CheR
MILEQIKELSDEELKSLTFAIKTKYGIDFTNYEKKSLKRGFARIIMKHKMGSVLGLWSKIMKDSEFIKTCIDELTVNLTELFRNPEIWIKIQNDIIPHIRNKFRINIWHAGCSSGEEVYTMAIVMHNAKLLSKVRTLATDLSNKILNDAIRGEYSSHLLIKYSKSFNEYLPNSNMYRYFDLINEKAVVKDLLRRHITFQQHNLVQDEIKKKFDVVFCRNVMIYFDETLKMKVLNLFHQSLEDEGHLIVGYYDLLPDESNQIFQIVDARARIYKKIKKN